MINWQQIAQNPRQVVDPVIHFIKARRREEATLTFAILVLWIGYSFSNWLTPELKDLLKPWPVVLIIQCILYVAGVALLAYAGFRLWRLVYVPDLPIVKDRPSAIKGPMAFTEGDGALFRKLGRETDLQRLLGLILDNQVMMVVVRGASGAGKTSLLRAGLTHILADKGVKYHYWEAVPTESEKMLLRAIQETWTDGAAKPATLDELVNPSDELGRQAHVIVLDQFEQLRGSKPIFRLLRKIAREAKPPHRITWVIAFRREFSADWMDFISPEQERGFRPPQDLSLRLFTADQAREVIGQLVSESNLLIEQAVVDNLVEAATVESEVSPVDIGIGLLVLAELHDRQSGKTVTIRDYQFAGGAEGLLTQYISRCLEFFPKESQEAILKAMLALRDPVTNQRVAEGLTADEIAAETHAEVRLLKQQLDRLAQRDARLLEIVTTPGDSLARYRLPHERLIPALYRLTGKLLAEVDQAKLKFENAFLAWQKNDKRSRYLLKAKELRLVERFETQIPWGKDEQEKKNYLRRSRRSRQVVRTAAVAAMVVLIGLSWLAGLQLQRFEGRRFLREGGYPPELYHYQHQLKKLELQDLDLERFTWLTSDSIEDLSLSAEGPSNSIAGLVSLSRCSSLKKLRLYLSNSQVIDLEPLSKLSHQTHLTLNPGDIRLGIFERLSNLSNLTELTLELPLYMEINLERLSKLSNLKKLTLRLAENVVPDLEPLTKLSSLTQLTLYLRGSQLGGLEPLSKLSHQTQLTLLIDGIHVRDLELLTKLSNLTALTLNFAEIQVWDLESLSKLSNLTQLHLEYRGSWRGDLESLSKLSNLTELTLDFFEIQVMDLEPLTKLSSLKQLTLRLSLLTLNLLGSRWGALEPLTKLSNLKQLRLGLGDIRWGVLEPLTKLSHQTQLTLILTTDLVSDLEPLTKLSNLTELSLDATLWDDFEPLTKLSSLTQLTLSLGYSQESNLEPLTKLSNLTELTLNLEYSRVIDLELLSKLTRLRRLSIDGANRTQRMSLRSIPASLVELKF